MNETPRMIPPTSPPPLLPRSLSEQLDYFVQQANHEDTILQSYRGLILTIHSVVLAGAAALLGAAFQVLGQSAHLNLLTITVCVAAIVSGWSLKSAKAMLKLKERELTYFHKQILEIEKKFTPLDRSFTIYKRFQESNHSAEAAERFIPYVTLTSRGADDRTPYVPTQAKGNAPSKRIVMAEQFAMIEIMWLLLLVCSIFAIWLV